MIVATVFLACLNATCAGQHFALPLQVPVLQCAIAAQEAIALAWPDWRVERVDCAGERIGTE